MYLGIATDSLAAEKVLLQLISRLSKVLWAALNPCVIFFFFLDYVSESLHFMVLRGTSQPPLCVK